MPWRSILGTEIEYPFAIAGLPVSKWTGKDKEWIHHYQRLHTLCKQLDSEVINLRIENTRLQNENNFMLKLINKDN